jgi:hypothetical protein
MVADAVGQAVLAGIAAVPQLQEDLRVPQPAVSHQASQAQSAAAASDAL